MRRCIAVSLSWFRDTASTWWRMYRSAAKPKSKSASVLIPNRSVPSNADVIRRSRRHPQIFDTRLEGGVCNASETTMGGLDDGWNAASRLQMQFRGQIQKAICKSSRSMIHPSTLVMADRGQLLQSCGFHERRPALSAVRRRRASESLS